jgi:hypothetical protein
MNLNCGRCIHRTYCAHYKSSVKEGWLSHYELITLFVAVVLAFIAGIVFYPPM